MNTKIIHSTSYMYMTRIQTSFLTSNSKHKPTKPPITERQHHINSYEQQILSICSLTKIPVRVSHIGKARGGRWPKIVEGNPQRVRRGNIAMAAGSFNHAKEFAGQNDHLAHKYGERISFILNRYYDIYDRFLYNTSAQWSKFDHNSFHHFLACIFLC